MVTDYSLELSRIIKEFSLETLYLPGEPENTIIKNNDVNRPGLQFVGYYKYFDNTRIQIIGKAEESFLKTFVLMPLALRYSAVPIVATMLNPIS